MLSQELNLIQTAKKNKDSPSSPKDIETKDETGFITTSLTFKFGNFTGSDNDESRSDGFRSDNSSDSNSTTNIGSNSASNIGSKKSNNNIGKKAKVWVELASKVLVQHVVLKAKLKGERREKK